MRLAALQHAFQHFVLHGDETIVNRIAQGALIDRQRRLAVYRDGYGLRLVEALEADYPSLRATMGERAFDAACRSYIAATPSAFRNLRWYGGKMAEFLGNTAPWRNQPCLADIAQFEWTLTLAFDAADAPHMRFEDFVALETDTWTTRRLHLHPSVQLIELRANAAEIRAALDSGKPWPAPALGDDAVTWLIWRKNLSTHYRPLSEPEAWALRCAREGSSFAMICDGLVDQISAAQSAPTAASWLRLWVDDELIAALRA